MNTYDLDNATDHIYDQILYKNKYGYQDVIDFKEGDDTIRICEEDGGEVAISDIPRLIEALQKAQELWGG